MDADPRLLEQLEALGDVFPPAVERCLGTLFPFSWTLDPRWNATPRLKGGFSHSFSLGAGNDDFGVIAVAGCEESLLGALEQEGFDREIVVDGIGELLNMLVGTVQDEPRFNEAFGRLNPSLPQYSAGPRMYPKAASVEGGARLGENALYLGFAVRRIEPA